MAPSLARSAPTSPVTFEIPTDEFRNHPIPAMGSGAKVGSCYVRVTDLPNFDQWLAVNPRVPKRNAKDVLIGQPVKGIIETLTESPADMAIKNLGLYLLVENAEHERRPAGAHVLRITLSDPERHGLANGGHTYAAIRQCVDNDSADALTDLTKAYVRLHIYQRIPVEKVAEMAEGLNRSKQVDDASLMNLQGLFGGIKKVMEGRLGADQICYSQGGPGEYYVTEPLLYLELFNCERFTDTKHPSGLYRQQKRMLEMFAEDAKSNDDKVGPIPMDLLVPRLPEILQLADKIRKNVPIAARLSNFQMGLMKPDPKKKERAGSDKHKNTPLHFIGTTMPCRVPNGWLLPLLAAFRANVNWNLAESKFDWIAPLDEVLDATINDLVRVCVTEHKDNGQKPEDVGTKASVYSQCFDKVALHLLRRGR